MDCFDHHNKETFVSVRSLIMDVIISNCVGSVSVHHKDITKLWPYMSATISSVM